MTEKETVIANMLRHTQLRALQNKVETIENWHEGRYDLAEVVLAIINETPTESCIYYTQVRKNEEETNNETKNKP